MSGDFTAKQLAQVLERAAKDIPDAFRRAALIAAQRARTALVRKTPVDQGIMKNAWDVVQTADGARVENRAPHAGIVEGGARPHGVNAEGILALRDWVMRKGLATYEQGPGRGKQGPARLRKVTTRRKYYSNAEAQRAVDAIVWGIVKKLKEEGQKGLFLARDLLPEASRWLGQEFVQQLRREATR